MELKLTPELLQAAKAGLDAQIQQVDRDIKSLKEKLVGLKMTQQTLRLALVDMGSADTPSQLPPSTNGYPSLPTSEQLMESIVTNLPHDYSFDLEELKDRVGFEGSDTALRGRLSELVAKQRLVKVVGRAGVGGRTRDRWQRVR